MQQKHCLNQKELARRWTISHRTLERWRWAGEGIGDADGHPIDPSPEAIDALLDVWPLFEAFQLTYVSRGLLLEQEKNVSAPSPNGPSAGRAILRRLRANVPRLPRATEPSADP